MSFAQYQRRVRVDKATPRWGVITRLDEANEDRVFLSVAALAELRQGVERLVPGAWRKKSIPGCERSSPNAAPHPRLTRRSATFRDSFGSFRATR